MRKALPMEETDVVLIAVKGFPQEQAEDRLCKQAAARAGQPGSQFDHDRCGFVVQKSALDGKLQRDVFKRLRARVLYLAHYPGLAGHRGGSGMYYTLRRKNDVLSVARKCHFCAKTRYTVWNHQQHLKLFPAAGSLEIVAINSFGSLRVCFRNASLTSW